MVCILWTHPHRKTFWSNDGKREIWGPWKFQTINGSDKLRHGLDEKYNDECKKWYDYFYSSYDSCLNMIQSIHHAKLYLDSLNIPNYHILQSRSLANMLYNIVNSSFHNAVLDLNFKKMWDQNRKRFKYALNLPIQNISFRKFVDILPRAADGMHAGVKGQELFGKAVVETIKNNDTILLKDVF